MACLGHPLLQTEGPEVSLLGRPGPEPPSQGPSEIKPRLEVIVRDRCLGSPHQRQARGLISLVIQMFGHLDHSHDRAFRDELLEIGDAFAFLALLQKVSAGRDIESERV